MRRVFNMSELKFTSITDERTPKSAFTEAKEFGKILKKRLRAMQSMNKINVKSQEVMKTYVKDAVKIGYLAPDEKAWRDLLKEEYLYSDEIFMEDFKRDRPDLIKQKRGYKISHENDKGRTLMNNALAAAVLKTQCFEGEEGTVLFFNCPQEIHHKITHRNVHERCVKKLKAWFRAVPNLRGIFIWSY